jgi:hypothetical protein
MELNALVLRKRGEQGRHVADRRVAFDAQHPLGAFGLLTNVLASASKLIEAKT